MNPRVGGGALRPSFWEVPGTSPLWRGGAGYAGDDRLATTAVWRPFEQDYEMSPCVSNRGALQRRLLQNRRPEAVPAAPGRPTRHPSLCSCRAATGCLAPGRCASGREVIHGQNLKSALLFAGSSSAALASGRDRGAPGAPARRARRPARVTSHRSSFLSDGSQQMRLADGSISHARSLR